MQTVPYTIVYFFISKKIILRGTVPVFFIECLAKIGPADTVAMGFVEVAVLATCAFCLVVVGHVTASQTTIDPKIGPQIGDESGAQLMT